MKKKIYNDIHIAGVNGPTTTLQTSFLPRAINAAVILWKEESTQPFLWIDKIARVQINIYVYVYKIF